MESKKPDNVVYSDDEGFNASVLPYGTNVGAPVIRMDDVVSWKSRGISNVNKQFESKFNELKIQYQNLMEEYEWNELVYNSKFSFEPVIGEIYHLYRDAAGLNFLSLIGPQEWNKEHIGTFKLNSEKKWILLN
ncbi:DUF2452 domain-containing protein [Flavobacterium sp. ALD4]|jgi:hypothetical protein|uniref:DUF2452 domain-containing protein n=1 Tax=Flavobacterium sp. ALD4 TaxID=2058314 RepID=UPI000C3317FC|nr:DUF2452 domain-containing protein [Flavobacterium sp. ALD4]PKH66712.1 DUF2452 domain-containing protein [Flavobacterium sp. ALD4]